MIGIKPGGRTDGSHLLASTGFYEDWSHEYVDMDYRIASVMRPALMKALGVETADALRGIPKTNTFFQRAIGTDAFTSAELAGHVAMCAPFLGQILDFVGPEVIILEGAAARDNFVRHQCEAMEEKPGSAIYGMRRGRLNCFFRKETAFVHPVGRRATLLTVGHPSHFGHLPTWEDAVRALSDYLGREFLPSWGEKLATAPMPESLKRTEFLSKAEIPQSKPTAPQRFRALKQPPASFRYSPIHDFWRELATMGPSTAEELHAQLDRIG